MHDYTYTMETLPAQDDWRGWADVLTRDDTGRIDCVPECMRHLCLDDVGEDGRLQNEEMQPSTPYGVAKFMLMNHPLPWRGSGLIPSTVRQLLARGFTGDEILRAAELANCDDDDEEEYIGPAINPYSVKRPGRPLKASSASDLYMIRSSDGPIKIGISVEPIKRLKSLQTGCPHRLEIVCIVDGGGVELEAEYHKRFAAHRLHGEWFEPHADILAEITRLTNERNRHGRE